MRAHASDDAIRQGLEAVSLEQPPRRIDMHRLDHRAFEPLGAA
jgi:hypothetical protein